MAKQYNISDSTTPIIQVMTLQNMAAYIAEYIQTSLNGTDTLKSQLADAFQRKDLDSLIDIIKTSDVSQIIRIMQDVRSNLASDAKHLISRLINSIENISIFLRLANNDLDTMNDLNLLDQQEVKSNMKQMLKQQLSEAVSKRINWLGLEKDFLITLTNQDLYNLNVEHDFSIKVFDSRKLESFLKDTGIK